MFWTFFVDINPFWRLHHTYILYPFMLGGPSVTILVDTSVRQAHAPFFVAERPFWLLYTLSIYIYIYIYDSLNCAPPINNIGMRVSLLPSNFDTECWPMWRTHAMSETWDTDPTINGTWCVMHVAYDGHFVSIFVPTIACPPCPPPCCLSRLLPITPVFLFLIIFLLYKCLIKLYIIELQF